VVYIKGCLLLITKLNIDIWLCKVIISLELGNQSRDQREQILVFDGHCIKGSIVFYQLKRTVFFLNEKDWYSYKRLRKSYLLCVEIFGNKSIQLRLFYREQRVYIYILNILALVLEL